MTGCVLVASVALACGEAAPRFRESGATEHMADAARAYQRVDDIERQLGGTARVVREVRGADGGLSHLVVRYSTPGKLSRLLAVDAQGAISSASAAEENFARAHRADWGALSIETARAVQELAPGALAEFLVWAEPGDAFESLAPILLVLDPRTEAFSDQKLAIVRLEREAIMAIAKNPMVASIMMVAPVSAEALSSGLAGSAPSSALSSFSEDAYASRNIFGTGVNVGIVEGFGNKSDGSGGGCRINDSHEAFEFANVSYQSPYGVYCALDSDCQAHCNGGSVYYDECRETRTEPGKLVCINTHQSAVASRISAAAGSSPHHAAGVDLFIANNFNGGNGSFFYDATSLLSAYNWMVANGVAVVSESYGVAVTTGAALYDARAAITDWYSRYSGITFVQASGNKKSDSPQEVSCRGFNNICVGAYQDTGYPSSVTDPDYFALITMPDLSIWKNPGTLTRQTPLELEKPDLVAEGFVADTSSWSSVDKWLTESGTSFSTPVVAGALALLTEDCAPDGVTPFSPVLNRALLRTSAWTPHSLEFDLSNGITAPTCPGSVTPAYPTAMFGCDYKAGAGPLDTRNLLVWCSPIPDECSPDKIGSSSTICAGGNAETPLDKDDPAWQPVPGKLLETSSEELIDNAVPSGTGKALTGGSNIQWREMYHWEKVRTGRRLRSTFSFYGCPLKSGSTYIVGSPAVNFDYLLVGRPAGQSDTELIWASEALDETNEGFDVRFVKDYDDVWVYVAADFDAWVGCNGSKVEPSAAPWVFLP